MNADTIVQNWYLVDFTQDGERLEKRVLWGIVVEDRKGRWVPGDWCCTSLVLEELANRLFRTRNSLYQADGVGTRMEAPVDTVELLRAGYSPDQWEALARMKDKPNSDSTNEA